MKRRYNRVITTALALMFAIGRVYAGDGLAGINAATTMVSSIYTPATNLMYTAGAVSGLLGGIRLYNKMQGGDPDSYKHMGSFLGACIILVIIPTLLSAFFM